MNRLKYWILNHPIVAYLLMVFFVGAIYFISLTVTGLLHRGLFGMIEAIIGGLIASLGTSAFLRYFFLQKETFGIKNWLGFGPKQVWIVPTYLENKSPRYPHMPYYTVPPFDAQAAGIMTQVLVSAGIHHPKRKIIGSHRLLKEVLEDNLILLCLPERNQYSRVFSGVYKEIYVDQKSVIDVIRFSNIQSYIEDVECEREYFGLKCEPIGINDIKFKEWQMRHFGMPPGKEWWRSSINMNPQRNVHQQGITNFDYAIIIKAPNPLNTSSGVIIICGIHGIGTLGGALFIYQNANELFRDYPAESQAHLIQIRYTVRQGVDNYVDSDLLSIEHLHYMPLHQKL